MKAFDFGANWRRFSRRALDAGTIAAAEESLRQLLGADALQGKSFLDVGSGSGVFSIAASRLGALPVLGVDVNAECVDVGMRNAQAYAAGGAAPEFRAASVLDATAFAALPRFDVVYAWGSLHHTGAMWEAIRTAASRVADGGTLVLAIYNRHLTSPVWKAIKWTYNVLPGPLRALMVGLSCPVIYVAKLLVTLRNPLRQQRGMSFFYNVVDWLGGYPYEYASAEEVKAFVEPLGFRTERVVPAEVPTGCNELVFRRV